MWIQTESVDMVGRGIVESTTVPQLRAPVGSLPLNYPLHLLQNSLLYHSKLDGSSGPDMPSTC